MFFNIFYIHYILLGTLRHTVPRISISDLFSAPWQTICAWPSHWHSLRDFKRVLTLLNSTIAVANFLIFSSSGPAVVTACRTIVGLLLASSISFLLQKGCKMYNPEILNYPLSKVCFKNSLIIYKEKRQKLTFNECLCLIKTRLN